MTQFLLFVELYPEEILSHSSGNEQVRAVFKQGSYELNSSTGIDKARSVQMTGNDE